MPLGTEVGLGPYDIVLDGDPAPPSPKREQTPSPIFPPCLLSVVAKRWMDQVTLDTEVGLGPGHIVLYRGTAPLPKKGQPPIFGPCLFWPNGWMD